MLPGLCGRTAVVSVTREAIAVRHYAVRPSRSHDPFAFCLPLVLCAHDRYNIFQPDVTDAEDYQLPYIYDNFRWDHW